MAPFAAGTKALMDAVVDVTGKGATTIIGRIQFLSNSKIFRRRRHGHVLRQVGDGGQSVARVDGRRRVAGAARGQGAAGRGGADRESVRSKSISRRMR